MDMRTTTTTTTIDNLNLDGMNADELWKIWQETYSVRPIRIARQWFADKPKGYVLAAKNIGHYASSKATAMMCRDRGDIQAAMMYEAICDRIYDRLPEYARWSRVKG